MPLPVRRALIPLLLAALSAQAAPRAGVRRMKVAGYELTRADVELLEDLSHRAFQYFLEQADPGTGLVRDRARTGGSPIASETGRDVASIAATGFGLTALCA